MPIDNVLNADAIAALKSVSPDDGGEFFNELVDIFLADMPLRLTEIETSLANGDGPTLQRAAHSIKGSSGNFGATALAESAHKIELLSKAGQLDAARAEFALLAAEFAKVISALAEVRMK